MRSALIAVLTLVCATGSAIAAPVTVNYEGSILEGQPGVDQGLPIYLSQTPNNVRFRFFVPGFASLTAINSINVSFDVYDDNANGFEQGDAVSCSTASVSQTSFWHRLAVWAVTRQHRR